MFCSSWMGLGIGGQWSYRYCFVECCFQDLFNIARSILVQFSSSFFFMRFVSVNKVHPYSCIDIIAVWKKSRFILSDRSGFLMIHSLSMEVHAIARHILTSLSVDETLLPRYMKLSINFWGTPFRVEIAPFHLRHMYSFFVCVHVETNAACCLFQALQQGFGLGGCIC